MERPVKRRRLGHMPAARPDPDSDSEADELNYSPEEIDERRDPTVKLAKSRATAALRLKSTFEHIFEKYERDFTGIGDEVDLRTGQILVDNGHLQTMRHERDMGDDLPDCPSPGLQDDDVDLDDEGICLDDLEAVESVTSATASKQWQSTRVHPLLSGQKPDDVVDDEDRILQGASDMRTTVAMNTVSRRPNAHHLSSPFNLQLAGPARLSALAFPPQPTHMSSPLSFGPWGTPSDTIEPAWRAPSIQVAKFKSSFAANLFSNSYSLPAVKGTESIWAPSRPGRRRVDQGRPQAPFSATSRPRLPPAKPTTTPRLLLGSGFDSAIDIDQESSCASEEDGILMGSNAISISPKKPEKSQGRPRREKFKSGKRPAAPKKDAKDAKHKEPTPKSQLKSLGSRAGKEKDSLKKAVPPVAGEAQLPPSLHTGQQTISPVHSPTYTPREEEQCQATVAGSKSGDKPESSPSQDEDEEPVFLPSSPELLRKRTQTIFVDIPVLPLQLRESYKTSTFGLLDSSPTPIHHSTSVTQPITEASLYCSLPSPASTIAIDERIIPDSQEPTSSSPETTVIGDSQDSMTPITRFHSRRNPKRRRTATLGRSEPDASYTFSDEEDGFQSRKPMEKTVAAGASQTGTQRPSSLGDAEMLPTLATSDSTSKPTASPIPHTTPPNTLPSDTKTPLANTSSSPTSSPSPSNPPAPRRPRRSVLITSSPPLPDAPSPSSNNQAITAPDLPPTPTPLPRTDIRSIPQSRIRTSPPFPHPKTPQSNMNPDPSPTHTTDLQPPTRVSISSLIPDGEGDDEIDELSQVFYGKIRRKSNHASLRKKSPSHRSRLNKPTSSSIRKVYDSTKSPMKRVSSSSTPSPVRTPSGTLRVCGRDDFFCRRDFCFRCIGMSTPSTSMTK